MSKQLKSEKIHAYAIDMTHIYIKCPMHKRKTFHLHGSCGNLLNRTEHRCGHCPILKYSEIIIDNDTIRGEIGKNKQILKRNSIMLNSKWEYQQNAKEIKELICVAK